LVVSGSTTTSNAESSSSASKVGEEIKVASQLRKFAFNDLKCATRNFLEKGVLDVFLKGGSKRTELHL
jgi:hypothetical protein